MGKPVPPEDITFSPSPHLLWIAAARAEAARFRDGSDAATISTFVGPHPRADAGGLWESLSSRYDVAAEIRRGGQGAVFSGVQLGTRREVAIKVLHAGQFADDASRIRFEREAQILAHLKHPNIVTVLESGVAAGHSYFVMDFVPGLPLDQYVREQRLGPRDILELFAKVCDAVNVAHLRGIIHRDLKPSNIRVDPAGEPHVLDFGLAKLNADDALAARDSSDLTMTGQFVGSLPWASPEQVTGVGDNLDIRTDVYSLGVMLFSTLTGRPPYAVDGGVRDTINHISTTEPPRPSSVAPALSDDVDQIVLKCLRKEPEQRYQSAGELARELRRYLAGEPIEAKRDSAWYMLRKRIRRYRVAAAIAGLILLLVVTSLIAAIFFYRQEFNLRTEAETARREADHERDAATAAKRDADQARAEAGRQFDVAAGLNEFFLSEIITQATPDKLGRDASLREVLAVASQRVDEAAPDDARTTAEIHLAMATAFAELGDLARAEFHVRRADELAPAGFGEETEEAIKIASMLVVILNSAGKLPEAVAIGERLVELSARVSGEEHNDTLEQNSNLGWLYARVGRIAEGVAILRSVHARRVERLGPDDEDSINVLHNLATALKLSPDRNDQDEAYVLRSEHLERATRVFGPDHSDTLRSRGQLALIEADRGNLAAAEAQYREVAARQTERLGPEHQSTVITLTNLVSVISRSGRREEAAAMLADLLPRARRALGENQSTVVSMTSNLSWLYEQADRFDDALPLAETALAGARTFLPETHATIGLYHKRLGRVYLGLERYEEAERELLDGYRILQAAQGDEHKETVESRAALVELYEAWGKPEKAAEWSPPPEPGDSD